MDKNKEINFIAKHYHKGLFAIGPTLRRIKGGKTPWWTPQRIAAACIAAAILTATASILVHNYRISDIEPETTNVELSTIPASEIVRVIDFEKASLPEVVAKIREVYGVEVYDIPSEPDQYTLSLHYEGSALDLVETINDILDTDMKVTE
ncbi:MAG: hypothetical protein K2K25_09220 [Muribaculaceae bacterium]|nr:hypothetical protein [Muribaculaceae bacterium]